METRNFVVLICLVLGVRSQTCDLIGSFQCLSSNAGFLEGVSLKNLKYNTNAETTVDTLCKTLDDLYVCIGDKMINCPPQYRLIYETALSSGRFICNAGKKGFIENFHCIRSEATVNNTMSCGGKLIDVIREIFANPGDTSQLLSRSAELCLKGSDVITCLIDSTNNDCGQTASTFLSEYMAASLKPLTSFLSCPGELGAKTEPQRKYTMSSPGINTPPSSVIYPEATPPNEHRKNPLSSTYPQPNTSSQPSHPEPSPSVQPSYPEPMPSSEPSYPEPTPSAKPSYPEPTPSSEPSYPEHRPSAKPSYPEPTPSAKPSYPEPTPSSEPSYPEPTPLAKPSYPEPTPSSEPSYPEPTPSSEPTYPEPTPSAKPSYPEPTPSAKPSYPEPTPSSEPSYPEPTPSAKPSYPEPTPSSEPSYPEPTPSAKPSYPKQMKTTSLGLYPEPTPSSESSYPEITPSPIRATTTGVDYNKMTTPKMICKKQEFKCRSSSCIPKAWICDGEKDCPGGEDEEGCKSYKCLPGSWQCDDGICIKYRYKCNGIRDCKYGEDEKGCARLTTTLRPKSSTTKTSRQPTTTTAPPTKKAPFVYVKPRVIKIDIPAPTTSTMAPTTKAPCENYCFRFRPTLYIPERMKEYYDNWCENNCTRGHCPQMCTCNCPRRSVDLVCRSVRRIRQGVHFDRNQWCNNVCRQGFCPRRLCRCRVIVLN